MVRNKGYWTGRPEGVGLAAWQVMKEGSKGPIKFESSPGSSHNLYIENGIDELAGRGLVEQAERTIVYEGGKPKEFAYEVKFDGAAVFRLLAPPEDWSGEDARHKKGKRD
ncbi:MAG: hypothetical protein HYS81_02135 [Candidatus Aenigmatarchaeota archaeon]|nr:MAG: hypothetical protein HYS81_02135 [Candidatus Aenigmarchaeota archaeon]